MSIGEHLMHESDVRLQLLRRRPGRIVLPLLHWGAWLNYFLSVIVLVTGITAGWRFAEIGFDLMMSNVTGEEVKQTIIQKIPAWIFIYKGIKDW
jgi:hypothetical protein